MLPNLVAVTVKNTMSNPSLGAGLDLGKGFALLSFEFR